MSFNEDELKKIQSKTSGWFKAEARTAISRAISSYKPKIEVAKLLPESERKKALLVLVNQATKERQNALQGGANSYSNPSWAAAATVESWLHELMGGDEAGISKVEAVVSELHTRA